VQVAVSDRQIVEQSALSDKSIVLAKTQLALG
jgi:hypothetical protein